MGNAEQGNCKGKHKEIYEAACKNVFLIILTNQRKMLLCNYMVEIIAFLNEPLSNVKLPTRENIAIMCEYIHIMCVEDTGLIEGIIREGFDFKMVACLVDGVEWMHACLFFADDLLQTPNNEKKLLYILLLSHIIKKYPTME